jgi:hypothetical protein
MNNRFFLYISKKEIITLLITLLFLIQIFNYPVIASTSPITITNSEENNLEIEKLPTYFTSKNYSLFGNIFYPTDTSKKYPCIIFCEGFPGYVNAYSWIPKALAAQGYITFIYDPPGLGKSEGFVPIWGISVQLLNLYFRFGSYTISPLHYFVGDWVQAGIDALTYLTEESPVNEMINKSSIGLIGHSFGGITASEIAVVDNRFDAVIAMSHANPVYVDDISIPIQFIGTDFDYGLFSIPMIQRSYIRANAPKEMIMIKLGTHFGFTTAFNSLCPCPKWQKDVILHYVIPWFDYFLKNDSSSLSIITSGTDNLSPIFKSQYNLGSGNYIL